MVAVVPPSLTLYVGSLNRKLPALPAGAGCSPRSAAAGWSRSRSRRSRSPSRRRCFWVMPQPKFGAPGPRPGGCGDVERPHAGGGRSGWLRSRRASRRCRPGGRRRPKVFQVAVASSQVTSIRSDRMAAVAAGVVGDVDREGGRVDDRAERDLAGPGAEDVVEAEQPLAAAAVSPSTLIDAVACRCRRRWPVVGFDFGVLGAGVAVGPLLEGQDRRGEAVLQPAQGRAEADAAGRRARRLAVVMRRWSSRSQCVHHGRSLR